MQKLDEHAQTRLAFAAAVAAYVKTVDETQPGFRNRFDDQLEKIYRTIEDYPSEPIGALEALAEIHRILAHVD